jgi:branched-chain amino acid transport system substrate-binding protein
LRSHRIRTLVVALTTLALLAAACGGDDDDSSSGGTTTTAAGSSTTEAGKAATGEPFTIGVVNIEGAPSFDFPEFTDGFDAAAKYVNEHGGLAGRPIKIEECIAQGTPESSQQCAQELASKKVELALIGLDIFTDYKTFSAAGIPVIGSVPILPGDYTADAIYLTGGNLSAMSAIAKVAQTDVKAKSVGIISTDNAAGNAAVAILEPALKNAGISFKTVKGGDNETDAGYQGLVRQANEGNPDALISLYAGPGCVGTIRARKSLGITVPALTTGLCRSKDVIDVVGDDADGWIFATGDDTGEFMQTMKQSVADLKKIKADEVNTGGFTTIGYVVMLTMADAANKVAGSDPTALTGKAIYDEMKTSTDNALAGGTQKYQCGQESKYPSVCTFGLQFSTYKAGGKLEPVEGGDFISGQDLLP